MPHQSPKAVGPKGARSRAVAIAPSANATTAGPLTNERLVDMALEIIHKSGVEQLTMRRLAEELGVTQMAAYHYIKSKDELLELALNRLLATITIPPPEYGPWDARLLLRFLSMIEVFRDYPGMAGQLLGGKLPQSGRRMVRATVAMLVDEGFSAEQALFIYGTVATWAHGHLAVSAYRGSGASTLSYYSRVLGPQNRPTAPRMQPDEFTLRSLEAVIRGVKVSLVEDGRG